MNTALLKDIAEISSGLPYKRYVDDDGTDFDVVLQKSIKQDGQLDDFEQMKFRKFPDKYFSREGDILVKLAYPNDIVCLKKEDEGLVIGNRIAVIRLTRPDICPRFIAQLLTNITVKEQLNRVKSPGRGALVSISALKELELDFPDYPTQVEYARLFDLINDKIKVNQEIIESDRNLKEGLLNDLLEGGRNNE